MIPVKADGTVLYPNITWVDGRAEKQAQGIMKKIGVAARRMKFFNVIAGCSTNGGAARRFII